MQFWLSFNNFAERLQLPVNPAGFNIKKGQKVSTVDVLRVGEVDFIGGEQLATITLEGFLPKHWAPYCATQNIPEPYDAIEQIDSWRRSGKPIRLIITDTPVNMPCTVVGFDYGEEGGTRNVNYTLELREYRFLTITAPKVATAKTKVEIVTRATAKEVPNSYTIKPGDSLYAIAKKLTGNGANWQAIYNANKATLGKDPKMIPTGAAITLPTFPAGATAARQTAKSQQKKKQGQVLAVADGFRLMREA